MGLNSIWNEWKETRVDLLSTPFPLFLQLFHSTLTLNHHLSHPVLLASGGDGLWGSREKLRMGARGVQIRVVRGEPSHTSWMCLPGHYERPAEAGFVLSDLIFASSSENLALYTLIWEIHRAYEVPFNHHTTQLWDQEVVNGTILFDRSAHWGLDPWRAAQGHIAGSESFDKATQSSSSPIQHLSTRLYHFNFI